MKVSKAIIISFLCLHIFGCKVDASKSKPRESISFDFNWKFALGEYPNASSMDFDDAGWRTLNLPHDWSIEGAYDSLNPAGIAGAFLPTGIGWYRKDFEFQPEWKGKKVRVVFDGVYLNSTVWINGKELGTYPNGYIGFEYDLTEHLTQGKNVLAVKVDHAQSPTGRWYTGSGIYRHVNLLVTNEVHVPYGGLFITSQDISQDHAAINVTTEIAGLNQEVPIKIMYFIHDPQGVEVLRREFLQNDAKSNVSFNLSKPNLWSPKTPSLYNLKLQLFSEDRLVDEVSQTFGIRAVKAGPDGLFINGEKTILKGVCLHHDAGPVGSAVPHDVLYDRLKKLKTMGCNAIRTTHNPFAPEFYGMTDSMGFLVMDEAFDGWEKEKAKFDYGLYFEEWWQHDLKNFILRDRNHPSVIFWSIGNEVKQYTDSTQLKLVEYVKSLDSTRYITQGRGYKGPAIDIAGFNGHGEYRNGLVHFHESNPTKPVIGTEITHSYQTRGI